jgi:hypothetical protein
MKNWLLPYENYIGMHTSEYRTILVRKNYEDKKDYCAIHRKNNGEYFGYHYKIIYSSKDLEEAKLELDKYMISQGFILLTEEQVEKIKVLL